MSEWQEIKLKQLTTKIGSGATPRGGQEAYYDSGISLIRSQNVLDFEFSNDGLAFIDEDQAQKLGNVVVEKDDILLNITGDSVARVCKVPCSILPARVNQHVSIIRSNHQKIDSDFLLYFLLNFRFKKYLLRLASDGGTRNALTKSDLESLSISVPPLDEQKSIAKVLTCLDRKIENLRKQNETLEKIAQTLFKHWFVDFEFPNEDGKPYKSSGGAMERSDLGEIPVGWRFETLKECLEHLIDNRGKTPEFLPSGIPTLSAKFVKGGDLVNRDSFNYVAHELFEQSERLKVGDVILTSEAPLGETYFIAKETNYYPAQRVFALRANESVISHSYLNYWLSSPTGQFFLKRRASGSTVQGIKQSELYRCEVLIPSSEIQKKASAVLTGILNKKEINSDQIQTLGKTRDLLLPKLMSGQIRLGD